MINSLTIQDFRGIHALSIPTLNRINLIVGDNNCGKTSVLEAILLLRNPSDLANLYRVAKLRDAAVFSSGITLFENFTYLFPHAEEQLAISVSAKCDGAPVECSVKGEKKQILIDASEIRRYSLISHNKLPSSHDSEMEAEAFSGTVFYKQEGVSGELPLDLNTYSKATGTPVTRKKAINISYVSPFEHLRGNIVNRIIKEDTYKEICIAALQLFDPEITDILLLKSSEGNRPIEYLKHSQLGLMPISTYGDGIKKVLVLANAIASSAGGVLLIDEVETAIHKKYYDDIFNFLVKASRAFSVQMFITTHSIEAIDGLLSTQNYDVQNDTDEISVVTIKKAEQKSYSRVLSGRSVAEDREAFGFEVRL